MSKETVTIITEDENLSKKTLLQELRERGVHIETNCLEGFCGMCSTKLNVGGVVYDEDPLAYIPKGSVLPCCSRASTKEIQLEIGM